MKLLKKITLVLGVFLIAQTGFGQMAQIKKFDYSMLKNKTLYIPTWAASSKFISKMKKKGKFDKITDAKAKAAHYNKIWKEAMAESSYDATDYEIRAYDRKKLMKSKNKTAILLYFAVDDNGNRTAVMMVTGPKRRIIGSTLVNGFDLSSKNDIRLMMNMLNDQLTTASELEASGDKSGKAMRNKGKERLISFYDSMKGKTFLVPKMTHKKPKKAAERNADVKTALKSWKMSKYEITTAEAIEKKRLEGDPDSFYWRDIPMYSSVNGIPITYHFNVILSTDGDEVVAAFMGKKRLKSATLDKIQSKITAKANRYKKQLGR